MRSKHKSYPESEYPDKIRDTVRYYQSMGHIVLPPHLLKTPKQLEGMRASSRINVTVLDYIEKNIRPGISTAQIDRWVYQKTTDMGGIPAPLGYEGFPKRFFSGFKGNRPHEISSDRNRK